MERVPCDLCGADEPVQVARKGRFDLPLSTVLCRRCRLVYTSPRMDPGEARRFYEEDYHALYVDRLHDGERPDDHEPPAAHVAETEQLASQRMALLRSVVEVQGRRVLDVGCGTGSFLERVTKAGGQGCGVEVAPDYAKFAREHYGLDVFCGTFEDFLATHDDQFEVVTLLHVLEHVLSPSDTLTGVRSILKENGVVCIQVPNVLHRFAGPAKTDMYVFLRSAHLYNFTERSLKNLLHKTGFQLVALYHVEPRYLFVVARPSEPVSFHQADGLWKMRLYFKAWHLWTKQRRWRKQAKAGLKSLAFSLLGEERVRRWVSRI